MVWLSDSHPVQPVVVVLVLLAISLAILPTIRAVADSRLRRLLSSVEPVGRGGAQASVASMPPRAAIRTGLTDGQPSARAGAQRRRVLLFTALAAAAVLVTVPSAGGGLAASAVAAATYLLLRGSAPVDGAQSRTNRWLTAIRVPGARTDRSAAADPLLPFAIELLAVCLRAGMPGSPALRSVSGILPNVDHSGPGATASGSVTPGVSVVLARVAAACELGSEPAVAWQDWLGHPVYGRLARALVVTGESGSAVAGRLEAVAQQLRIAEGQQTMARAQRAGVLLMAPLGLCFLPAFVCLGVVPVVVGIAGRVFG